MLQFSDFLHKLVFFKIIDIMSQIFILLFSFSASAVICEQDVANVCDRQYRHSNSV